MHIAASALTSEDIRALAAYYASAPADADGDATAAPATAPHR
jgi:cytochrome c553